MKFAKKVDQTNQNCGHESLSEKGTERHRKRTKKVSSDWHLSTSNLESVFRMFRRVLNVQKSTECSERFECLECLEEPRDSNFGRLHSKFGKGKRSNGEQSQKVETEWKLLIGGFLSAAFHRWHLTQWLLIDSHTVTSHMMTSNQ